MTETEDVISAPRGEGAENLRSRSERSRSQALTRDLQKAGSCPELSVGPEEQRPRQPGDHSTGNSTTQNCVPIAWLMWGPGSVHEWWGLWKVCPCWSLRAISHISVWAWITSSMPRNAHPVLQIGGTYCPHGLTGRSLPRAPDPSLGGGVRGRGGQDWPHGSHCAWPLLSSTGTRPHWLGESCQQVNELGRGPRAPGRLQPRAPLASAWETACWVHSLAVPGLPPIRTGWRSAVLSRYICDTTILLSGYSGVARQA